MYDYHKCKINQKKQERKGTNNGLVQTPKALLISK